MGQFSRSNKKHENQRLITGGVILVVAALVLSFGVQSKSALDEFSPLLIHVAKGHSDRQMIQSNPSSSSSSASSASTLISLSLLEKLPLIDVEEVWNLLIKEGAYVMKHDEEAVASRRVAAIEVGMHVAKQCIEAAEAGLYAHCLEPSPRSFGRVQLAVSSANKDIQDRISLYQVAAGPVSGENISFQASGGTGDHVGEFDIWNMKPGKPKDPDLVRKAGELIQVPTIRLDDIVMKDPDHELNFLLKVDTQGFEPAVFSGLTDSISQHLIPFILMEYWPKGMDLLANKEDGTCVAADLLDDLVNSGYKLYALPTTLHKNGPLTAQKSLMNFKGKMYTVEPPRPIVKRNRRRKNPMDDIIPEPIPAIPTTNLHDYCSWFYQLEKQFAVDYYKMGYWSDVLAVSPQQASKFLKRPQTRIGKLLHDEL